MRVITRLNIGGPAIHALLLTRELSALQYSTTLVAGHCEPEDGDMSYLVATGDPVRWIPALSRSVRPWHNLIALWQLWRLMRRERPAIVHTHTAMAGCLGRLAAVLSGAPVIVHTFHGNSLSQYFSRFSVGVFQRIEQLLARFTDVLCVVSPQQADELSGKFQIAPRAKFHVVPLGLELAPYFALDPPAHPGTLTVGWFGRLVPVKNVPLLIETIEHLLDRGEDIRFLIAGDGPDRDALQRLLPLSGGRVEWLGWQRDIAPVLARCHAVLQTSRNEGTPVALIQAMAAARPFVSTAVGGVVDMVCGETGARSQGARWYGNAVLAESNAGALAAALSALAQDRELPVRMGFAARAFAARHHRKEQLVANLDALYRELLQKKLGKVLEES